MKQKTIAIPLVALAAFAPAVARASGPLLSGYGGPGAGAQTIIGATLLNGSREGSGGGSAAGGSGGGSSALPTSSSAAGGGAPTGGRTSAEAGGSGRSANANHGAAGAKHARGGSASNRGGVGGSGTGSSSIAAAMPAASTSWFSSGDLLVLVLVLGALVLVTVATLRLAGGHHD